MQIISGAVGFAKSKTQWQGQFCTIGPRQRRLQIRRHTSWGLFCWLDIGTNENYKNLIVKRQTVRNTSVVPTSAPNVLSKGRYPHQGMVNLALNFGATIASESCTVCSTTNGQSITSRHCWTRYTLNFVKSTSCPIWAAAGFVNKEEDQYKEHLDSFIRLFSVHRVKTQRRHRSRQKKRK